MITSPDGDVPDLVIRPTSVVRTGFKDGMAIELTKCPMKLKSREYNQVQSCV
jgi:hypothetical protein